MADHSESIAQFISMTNASESQAQFFLGMTDWNLEAAVTQYFDNNGAEQQEPTHTSPKTAEAVAAEPLLAQSIAGSSSTKKRATSTANASKIRTLSDFNSLGQNNDSDDEERENLYAGGEKSGMVVQGPNKRAGGGNNLVDEILKKAAEGGSAPEEEKSKSQKKPTYYTGSGYRLGSEDEPSTLSQPAPPIAPTTEENNEPVTRHLTFWRNGFSVDDGPLFEYTDPANQEMLTAINSGRAPLSLLNVRHGQPVEVRVAKRQDEDYKPPPKTPPKPFEGTGNRLGSPAAYTSSSPAPGSFPASASTAAAPTVDDSQPITNIQIRLGDGTRLVAKLNHTHTIADLRQFIESSRPDARPYILQTTFPVKELKDSNQTVKEAGLLNSVIVQRYQ